MKHQLRTEVFNEMGETSTDC